MLRAVLALTSCAWAQGVGLAPEDVIRGATSYAAPPAKSTAAAAGPGPAASWVSAAQQGRLVELWKRRIVAPGTDTITAEDLRLLDRIKDGEALGAFDLLRERMGTLQGFAVLYEVVPGRKRLWLTKPGFQQYLFLKSQAARKYFEEAGTDAKFIFQIRGEQGKKLFDGRGVLTAAGDTVYNRILRGRAVRWKEPNGTLRSNVRPLK